MRLSPLVARPLPALAAHTAPSTADQIRTFQLTVANLGEGGMGVSGTMLDSTGARRPVSFESFSWDPAVRIRHHLPNGEFDLGRTLTRPERDALVESLDQWRKANPNASLRTVRVVSAMIAAARGN